MDFKDLQEIKNKRNNIQRIRFNVKLNISDIDNTIINGIYESIIDNIDNNVEINIDSLNSMFDFQDEPNSKKLILDNIILIDKLNLSQYINHNDYEKSFSKINDEITSLIISQLDIDGNIELYDFFNYDIETIIDLIVDGDFDEIDFMDYLDKIENFYDSMMSSIEYMNNNYKDYY